MECSRIFTPAEQEKGLEVLKTLSGRARHYYDYMQSEPGADLKLYGYETEAGERYAFTVYDIYMQDLTAQELQTAFEGLFKITLEYNGEDPRTVYDENYGNMDSIINDLDNATKFESI